MADLYLGIDLGTTRLKVGAFDAQGKCHGLTHASYELDRPHPDWAQQDANAWWSAFTSALGRLGEGVELARVSALSIVGQGPTVVPVDEAGVPLRPAITWADRRSGPQAQWLSEKLRTIVNPEFEVLPRVMWIRDEEAQVYARTRWFLQPYDFLSLRLTGKAVTVNFLQDVPPWTPERLEAAGLDPAKFPERTANLGDVVGTVAPGVAAELGFGPDVLVIAGTVDAFGHWIGSGLSEPGRLSNIGGSSEGVSLAWGEALPDPQHRVHSLPNPFGTGVVVGGAMSNSNNVLGWSAREIYGEKGKSGAAAGSYRGLVEGPSYYTPAGSHRRSFGGARKALLEAVAGVPAGSSGVLALPYLAGERTPIYDPNARVTFAGIGPSTTSAHMARALLEGVAFGVRQIVEVFYELGGRVDEVVVTGGSASAGEWNRIKASVLGRPVRVPEVLDAGVLGAAIIARSGVEKPYLEFGLEGLALDLAGVAQEMVRLGEWVEPDEGAAKVYEELYPLYLELYAGVKGTLKGLASLQDLP